MGISDSQANKLFYRFEVDRLPDDQAKAVTLELLEKLRDNGDTEIVTWDDVLPEDLRRDVITED